MSLKKTINTVIDDFFTLLVDPKKQNAPLRILRTGLRLHPFLYILYHYRAGNIYKAAGLIDKWSPRTDFEKRICGRVREIAQLIREGWRVVEPVHFTGAPFNRRIVMALHNSFPYDGAGYAVRSHQILQNLQRSGLDVVAVTRLGYPWDLLAHLDKPFRSEDTLDNIRYLRLTDDRYSIGGIETEYLHGYAHLLSGAAKSHEAHIIHAASNYLNGLAAASAARIIRGKSIFEMRGLWHLSRAIKDPGFGGSDHYRYSEMMEIAAAREVHAVVTLSGALKEYLTGNGIVPEKITVIPNAVDPDHFQPMSPDVELKQKLGLQGRTVIGFIGSLTHYEGLDLVIESVSRLVQEGVKVSLLIVGGGYAEQELRKYAEASPHRKHIQFTGRVPFRDVRKYYSIIDIFPFPRKGYEVCRLVPPLKVLEVMAMTGAVIVSDLPPLLEMVQHGKTGLVCRTDDSTSLMHSIRTLTESPELRQNLGHAARDWVQRNRSWTEIAQRYLDLYLRL